MTLIHNKGILKTRRTDLRKSSTDEEEILWQALRRKNLGYKFKRQHSVGPYILDFYCATKKLAIELDGSQHKDNKDYDMERTNFLNDKNIKVLRFWNKEVSNIKKILEKIKSEL